MDELYVYELNKSGIYLNKRSDSVICATDIKNGRKLIISHNNDLTFISNGTTSACKILLYSTEIESDNVFINVFIPFYSRNILKKLIQTFSNVYLITNFPCNNNTVGVFSIFIPKLNDLEYTVIHVKNKLNTNISNHFNIIKFGYIHVYDRKFIF